MPSLFASVFVGLLTAGAAGDKPAAKPNILLLIADDYQYDALGAAGNDVVKTPSLDKLAKEGIRFTHAFTPNPICTPSRACILTGQDSIHNGVTFFGKPIHADSPTITGLLTPAGYACAYVGKWHNDGLPATRGYGWSQNVYPGGMAKGGDHSNIEMLPTGKPPKVVVPGDANENFVDAAIRFLDQAHAEPFFLTVAFTSPHDPRKAPEPYRTQYSPGDVPVPENFLPKPAFSDFDPTIRDEKLAPYPRTPDRMQKEIADYYGMVTHLDGQVGRLLDELERKGLAKDTMVVFVGDHGLSLGSHGILGKQTLYDEGVRTTLLVRDPFVANKGETRAALVSLMDLLPTFCDWAGVAVPKTVDGSSLNPLIKGTKTSIRDEVYAIYDNKYRSIRDQRYKLVQHIRSGEWELFDLEKDPREMQNRADDPALASVRQSLQEKLDAWREKMHDPDLAQQSSQPKPQK